MLQAGMIKNDKRAYWLIGIFSLVVFAVVLVLGKVQYKADLGFDIHIFAKINAVINSLVAVCLAAALAAVKNNRYLLHKRLMMTALVLSVLFLVFYIAHHLLAGETKFGGIGIIRLVYFIILVTHIFLAAIILPFILLTAYRALTADYAKHKKIARYTWPLWFYVAVTGPVVYLLISPYYS
jgi:putative membrane protein